MRKGTLDPIRIFLAAVTASAAATCAPQSDRQEVFRRYVEAINRNAVSEALAFHTPDAEFIIPGQNPIRGTEPMRALLQWDSVLTSELRFGPAELHGDTLIIEGGSERNLWFQGVGLDSIAYGPGLHVVFDGNLIAGIYPSSLLPESAAEFEARVSEFMGWASENASSELARLVPGGLFRYDREAAKTWLDVLHRYGARTDSVSTP